jgi:FixJ family two-component response regulator
MTSEKNKVVYVVDDEAGMRKALTRLLRLEGFEVVAFASAREFLVAYQTAMNACLILDVTMPELNGLELQSQLTRDGVLLPVIFLTGNGDIPMSVRAIKAGAVDFLTKPVNDADLLRAIRAGFQMAESQQSEREELARLAECYALLTPRECEVMAEVVAGKLNKQIASDLGTGEQNIKIHRGRVMEKMRVESLADLVRAAEHLGIGRPAGKPAG